MKMLKKIKWSGDKIIRVGDVGRFFGQCESAFALNIAEGKVIAIGEDRNFGYLTVNTKTGVRLLRK